MKDTSQKPRHNHVRLVLLGSEHVELCPATMQSQAGSQACNSAQVEGRAAPEAIMLGFVIPLLGFCALLGAMGVSLILPLPFARPTIYLCKLTQTQAGISVITTISVILACLLAAPLYDLANLHARPENTAGVNAQRRSTEAASHLSAILTAYDLLAIFVVRKLGLSLGELDSVVSGTKSVNEVKASVTAFGSAPADKQL